MWRALEVGRIGRVCRPNISCKVLPIWPVQAQVCHPLSHHCCRGCVEQLECRHTSRAAVACVHHDIEAVLMMQFIERQPPFQVKESRHALVGLCYDNIRQYRQVNRSGSQNFGVHLMGKDVQRAKDSHHLNEMQIPPRDRKPSSPGGGPLVWIWVMAFPNDKPIPPPCRSSHSSGITIGRQKLVRIHACM